MSRIPPLRTLKREDFPKQKDWITKLLEPINSFFRITIENLNKGLTFRDNMNSQLKTLTFVKTSSYPAKDNPLKFKNELKVSPIGLIMLKAEETADNPSPLSSAFSVSWSFDGTTVNIESLPGLEDDKQYKILFLSIGG